MKIDRHTRIRGDSANVSFASDMIGLTDISDFRDSLEHHVGWTKKGIFVDYFKYTTCVQERRLPIYNIHSLFALVS